MKLNVLLPLVSLACAGILSGCASSSNQNAAAYHPETEARVRVYWGATVDFYFNTNCVPTHDAKRITASRPGLSSLTNKTIGMPVPPDAGRYFHEYIVPAEQPLTIRAQVVSETVINATRYKAISPERASTLVPQHGHDYEIIVRSGDVPTQIVARELVQNDAGVSTKPFDIAPTHSCQ